MEQIFSLDPSTVTVQSYASHASTNGSWSIDTTAYTIDRVSFRIGWCSKIAVVSFFATQNGSEIVGNTKYTRNATASGVSKEIFVQDNNGNNLAQFWNRASSGTLGIKFYQANTSDPKSWGTLPYKNIQLVFYVTENESQQPSTVVIPIVEAGTPQTVYLTNENEKATHTVTWSYPTVADHEESYGAATRSPAWAIP